MSSKGITVYVGNKRGGKRSVTTATPNNSPIQSQQITRQLTAKEKKKAQRKLYKKRRQFKQIEASFDDFAKTVQFIAMNQEGVDKIAGPQNNKGKAEAEAEDKPKKKRRRRRKKCKKKMQDKVIVEEIADKKEAVAEKKEAVSKEEIEVVVEKEQASSEERNQEQHLLDIANSQSRPEGCTEKQYKKLMEQSARRNRMREKAIENYNAKIGIIQSFHSRYPALANAYLAHKFGKQMEEDAKSSENCHDCSAECACEE